MKRSLIGILIIALAGTLLWAMAGIEEKPFTEWTEKDVHRILKKSGWVAQEIVRSASTSVGLQRELPPPPPNEGSGAGGGRGTASYPGASAKVLQSYAFDIRFMSARPVRMALARWGMLNGRLDATKAQEFVDQELFRENIVVSVSIPVEIDIDQLEKDTGYMQDQVFLFLKKSGRKLNLSGYVPPSQTGRREAYFLFPRLENGKETVTASDGRIRFECRLDSRHLIAENFKLKKMIFAGRLEI